MNKHSEASEITEQGLEKDKRKSLQLRIKCGNICFLKKMC